MKLSPRQIHLDFHTSEHIKGIGKDFSKEQFAQTFKDAHVSSVTVFGRCHHGWLYYPSTRHPEMIHPHLANKNLMIEQVEALHSVGIKAPIYITVQWDHYMAKTHPQWLIRKPGGLHEGTPFSQPGFYQSLCVNTGYFDYLKEITQEICEIMGERLDGLFFDIVGYRPCWCASCRKEMAEKGVDTTDEKAVWRFAKFVIDRFRSEMTEFVRRFSQRATIFYNAGHIGPDTRTSMNAFSHYELESLPSGGWGYLHFPLAARYARTHGKECMGMTGKFHTSWGDFHSLKNLASLEFECFRSLSYGFSTSVGDQLEPFGAVTPANYRLIGKVFRAMEEREEWALDAIPVNEVAVITPEWENSGTNLPESMMGACQMLEELAIQFDIIDREINLDSYQLIILPDDLFVSEDYQKAIDTYVASGGKVIAIANGGRIIEGNYPSSFGITHVGKTALFPDFIQTGSPLTKGLDEAEYAIYLQGEQLKSSSDTIEILMEAVSPFFNREGEKFCSHRYTPSSKGKPYPVALRHGNVIVLSHPLFLQYRECAPLWCKVIMGNAIDQLLDNRILRHDGPSTMTASLMEQPHKNRYNAHLLSYIPVRKSATIDIIEERTKLKQITLKINAPKPIKSARLVPEGTQLSLIDGVVLVPEIDGYAIVELAY